MIFINHNSLLNIHYINALSSASSLLMSIKTPTAAGLDLSPNVHNYSPLRQDASHTVGHGALPVEVCIPMLTRGTST